MRSWGDSDSDRELPREREGGGSVNSMRIPCWARRGPVGILPRHVISKVPSPVPGVV